MASRTITDSASELVLRNRLRKSFIIQNQDGAINIFIKREDFGGLTVSSTDNDHRISPGGFLGLQSGQDGVEAIQGRYTVIAASGTPRVAVFETEDVLR